ncbi:MAG: hypothetical protein ING22_06565 [Burkholderiales bacterium]|nr:hypothetical protein [Burkholderiales bacterium]
MEIAHLNDLKPRYTTSAGRIFTRDTEVVERVEALIGAHRRLLDSSYLGAFLADTFIDYPKLERLSLTISVSDEYDDNGGTYKSAHVHSVEINGVDEDDVDSLFPAGDFDGLDSDKFDNDAMCLYEGYRESIEYADLVIKVCRDQVQHLLKDISYVIYSANEAALQSGAGFWSNEFGWTIEEEATRFSRLETETVNVPISTGADAVWKKIDNNHIEIDGWEAFGAFFPERKAEIEARRLQARL